MGIKTIEKHINSILNENKKLFIPYIMCGDDGFDKTEKVIRLLENSGASIIEIGIPFSDPIADGPVIQSAGQRALDRGVTLKKTLTFLPFWCFFFFFPRKNFYWDFFETHKKQTGW